MDELLERALPALRQRGLLIVLVLMALVVLTPSPVPRQLRTSLAAAQADLQSGRADRDSDELARALQIEPNMPAVRARAIEMALSSGDGDLALFLLESGLTDEPHLGSCWQARAQILTEPPDVAADAIEGAPSGCPIPPETIAGLADRALSSGDYETAARLQSERVSRQPDSAPALSAYGQALALTNPAAALAPLRQALDLDLTDPAVTSELIRAIENSRGATDPAYSLAQVGQAFARHGMWQPARLAFSRALELEPDYVEAQAFLGLALDRLGSDGLAELEAAAKAAPEAALPASLLGMHWLERGETERALPPLARAAALRPEDPAHAAQYAAALAANGDLQHAFNEYQRAAELAPNNTDFLQLLTGFCLANELDAGGDCMRAARHTYLVSSSASSASDLGYAHFLAGNLGVAGRLLRQAAALEPDSALIHYRLGLLALAQGNPTKAQDELNQASSLDPDGPLGDLARRTLERSVP
ncbi:MAG: tetratricopeptide repeat protein [Anaerolineales bacterium]